MMENTFFDRLRCFMPLIVALGTLLIGGCFMLLAIPGHIPDVWAHIYRIDGILNGICSHVQYLQKACFMEDPVMSAVMWHGSGLIFRSNITMDTIPTLFYRKRLRCKIQ